MQHVRPMSGVKPRCDKTVIMTAKIKKVSFVQHVRPMSDAKPRCDSPIVAIWKRVTGKRLR